MSFLAYMYLQGMLPVYSRVCKPCLCMLFLCVEACVLSVRVVCIGVLRRARSIEDEFLTGV